jgi:threonine-phosphate decarboxylase
VKHIHGGNITQAKDRYNLKNNDLLDFSANINFLGPPTGLFREIKKGFNRIIHYPEPDSFSLKKKLAGYLGIEGKQLVIGNGAAELIYQLVKVIKPELALVMAPTFSEYELAVLNLGGKVKYLRLMSEKDFKVDIDEFILNLDQVRMLFICNPNNPTGTLIKRTDLVDLLNYASKKGVFVVFDEAFIDFVTEPEDYTVIKLLDSFSNLFILRSMTKFYAIPGLRLGYGIGPEDIISQMESGRDPWSVNTFAQIAGEVVLEDVEYKKKTRESIFIEREYFYQALQDIKGLKPFLPTANFILIDISETGLSSGELTDILAKMGILIRDCSSFQGMGKDYIRVAVKSREHNLNLIRKLTELSRRFGSDRNWRQS